MIGEQHTAIANWLARDWWAKGSPLALIEGFPGTGKTEIAVNVLATLAQLQPAMTTIIVTCPETSGNSLDDLLLVVAEQLDAAGDKDLVARIDLGEDSATILGRLLAGPRLVVIDEAQRLRSNESGAVAGILERWAATVGARGRVLLLSSRNFGAVKWRDRAEVMPLRPLKPEEAVAFLQQELEKAGRGGAVPGYRARDVVNWLGRNPRAIRLLVRSLADESLEDLIGLAPEAWEARNRVVSPSLLQAFERTVLQRAAERLEPEARFFLQRLSVLRQPVDRRGLESLAPDRETMPELRDELADRFLINLRSGWCELHPVLRDTLRSQMTDRERRRAHAAAGAYYAAPFRARQLAGEADRLGAAFIEARYHFTMAESEADLVEIAGRFEASFLRRFHTTSPVPADVEERDEQIALLSALLQARGAKALEHYLARCLIARGRPGDLQRALPHVRRATGPQSPATSWVLRIEVERELAGVTAAMKVAHEGMALVPAERGQHLVCDAGARTLAMDGQIENAVALLKRGIAVTPPTRGLSTLYHTGGEILHDAKRPREAIALLMEGTEAVPIEHDAASLYRAAAEFLRELGDDEEALAVLGTGIRRKPPPHGLVVLSRATAQVLADLGRRPAAIALLRESLSELKDRHDHLVPLCHLVGELLAEEGLIDEAVSVIVDPIPTSPKHGRHEQYQAAAEILGRAGRTHDAIALLQKGVQDLAPTQNLHVLYQAAGTILVQTDPPEAIRWLLEGAKRLVGTATAYRVSEPATIIAYAAGCLPQLDTSDFDDQVKSLHAVLSALAAGQPQKAAQLGDAAINRRPTAYLTLHGYVAFAHLAAGEPGRAQDALNRFPHQIRHGTDNSITWLAAMIALALGELERATAFTETYLNRRLSPGETVDVAMLIRLWIEAAETWGGSVAYYFPRLPSRLTGQESELVHRRHRSETDGPKLDSPEPTLSEAAVLPAATDGDFNAAKFIRAMRPDHWYGVYVLGCYDQLKTVYTQQCRALSLIHALFVTGELGPGRRLGVVGGGVAGLTAAAAAAHKGANVVLFESAESLLHMQRQNTKRYIHPNLYQWPKPGAADPHAHTPLLNWSAGPSNRVADEILAGFEAVRQSSKRIEVRTGTRVAAVERQSAGRITERVCVTGPEGEHRETFDTLVIAIGFGVEPRSRCGLDNPPYWEDDGLEQALGYSAERPQRILVSGSGDGALIDILRATVRDFRHDCILDLLPPLELGDFGSVIASLETDAKLTEITRGPDHLFLQPIYEGLAVPPELIETLRAKVRLDTKVSFNFRKPARYDLNSSALNRFLVSTLCRMKAVRPKLETLTERAVARDPAGMFSVTWQPDTEAELFDRIVIRHGPDANYLQRVFPEVAKDCGPLSGRLRDLALTESLEPATRAFFRTASD